MGCIRSDRTTRWIHAGATTSGGGGGGGGLTELQEAGLLSLHGLQLLERPPREGKQNQGGGGVAAARAEAEALWRAAAPTVRLGLALQQLVGCRGLPWFGGRRLDWDLPYMRCVCLSWK